LSAQGVRRYLKSVAPRSCTPQVDSGALGSSQAIPHVPQPFYVKATNTVTGEVEEQSGTFPDEEWRRLTQFLTNANRLASCRMAESQHQLSWGIAAEKGEPARFRASLPPEDDIAAFLHYLRPFVLEKSPTNFTKARKIMARRVTLPAVRRYLDRLLAIYSGEDIAFKIEVGSRAGELVVNSDDTIRKWLNGMEYHHDDDKDAEIRAMYEVFPEPAARALLVYCMLQRASAIGKLGAMIDGLSKRDGREVRSQ
jgi:hypothetical protein